MSYIVCAAGKRVKEAGDTRYGTQPRQVEWEEKGGDDAGNRGGEIVSAGWGLLRMLAGEQI